MTKQPDLFGGETENDFGWHSYYHGRHFVDDKMQAILEIYGWSAVERYMRGDYTFYDDPAQKRLAFTVIDGGKGGSEE